jgi:hypothetical protein
MAFSRQERDEAVLRERQQRLLLTAYIVLALAVVFSAAIYRRRLARSGHDKGAAHTRVVRTRASGALPSPESEPAPAPLPDSAPSSR